jgi:glycosyltransferase involved in cell wall biosynthesis
MKILFDARYIRTDYHDGISRYSTELGKALADIAPVTFIICDQRQLGLLPSKAKYVMAPAPSPVVEPRMSKLMNEHHPDVVFSPLQTFGAAGRNFKLILTTHDLIYYRHRTPPTSISTPLRLGWFLYHLTYVPQRLGLNAADMVATVSHTVQREIEQENLTKRPVVVIPNAPQLLRPYVEHVDQSRVKNIVYMGSFMPYKNVETLIKGMKWLPDHTLHLLSPIKPKRRKELEALIPPKARVVFHNGVADKEYAELLADKAILATASFDEGYGIPIAEALGMGIPAVISDIPIFHEVAAGGALYFDPTKPKQFADRVKEMGKKSVRAHLAETGQAHIASFTWRASAKALLNAINSLV